MLERNPVAAWTGGAGTGSVAYFTYHGHRFATSTLARRSGRDRQAAQAVVRKTLDWRLVT